MKKILKKSWLVIIVVIFSFQLFFVNYAEAYVSVKGYTKKNGTYVAPYVRSNSNGLKNDNYGYKTGQGLYNKSYGTKDGSWDAPSYVTDKNYYKGKTLYNSKTNVTPIKTKTIKFK